MFGVMLPGESFSCPLCKIHLRKSVTSPQGDIPQSPAGQDDKPCLFFDQNTNKKGKQNMKL